MTVNFVDATLNGVRQVRPADLNQAFADVYAAIGSGSDVAGKISALQSAVTALQNGQGGGLDAAGLGSALVKASNGTVARSLARHFGDVLNVRDFGAAGDGATDDTVAIQAALTAAQSLRMPVYVPAGLYVLSGKLTYSGSGFALFGDGVGISILQWTQNATLRGLSVSLVNDTAPLTLQDLSFWTLGQGGTAVTLDCTPQITGGGPAGSSDPVTVSRSAPRLMASNVSCRFAADVFSQWWDVGLDVISGLILTVDSFAFEGGKGDTDEYKSLIGLRLAGGGHPVQLMVTNSSIYNAQAGISAVGVEGLHVATSDIVGVTNGVVFDDSANSGFARPHCVVTSCHINACGAAVLVNNGAEFLITANDLYFCSDARSGVGYGLFVTGAHSTAGVVVGNNFNNSHASLPMYGVYLDHADNTIIDCNGFRSATQAPMSGIYVGPACKNAKPGGGNLFAKDVGQVGSFGFDIKDEGQATRLANAFVVMQKLATTQLVEAGTPASVLWDAPWSFQSNNGFWKSSNPGKIVISAPGLWRISGGVVWDQVAGGSRTVNVLVNNAPQPGLPSVMQAAATGVNVIQNFSSAPIRLYAFDEIAVQAATTQSAYVLANNGTWVCVERIGD